MKKNKTPTFFSRTTAAEDVCRKIFQQRDENQMLYSPGYKASLMVMAFNSLIIFALVCCSYASSIEVTSDINGDTVFNEAQTSVKRIDVNSLAKRIKDMNNIELLVVLWISPWCDACSKILPVLQEASVLVHQHPIELVVSDPSDMTDPTSTYYRTTYAIENYPHITIFRDGVGFTYDDDMSPTGIAEQLTLFLHREITEFHMSNSSLARQDTLTLSKFNKQLAVNPIAVLILTNGSTSEWSLDDSFDSPDGCEIIVIDATSEHCESILFTAPNRPRWKVRDINDHASKSTTKKGPQCLHNLHSGDASNGLYPQAFVLHWKDPTLIAPFDWIMNTLVHRSKPRGLNDLKYYEASSKNVELAVRALIAIDNGYTSQGAPAILEPPHLSIFDLHGVSTLVNGPRVTNSDGSSLVTVALLYDRGGYIHSKHPISDAVADKILYEHILQTFTAATHIIKSDTFRRLSKMRKILTKEESSGKRLLAGNAGYLRLDRMEEKAYQLHDAMGLLKVPQVPAVLIFEDSTAFERVPCIIHPDNYDTASMLATAIQRVIESDDESIVKAYCGRGRNIVEKPGEEGWRTIIDASTIPKEEMHNYIKKRPRRHDP